MIYCCSITKPRLKPSKIKNYKPNSSCHTNSIRLPLSVSSYPFFSYHLVNAMNSTLTPVSFQSPRFKLEPGPRHHLHPRCQEIKRKPGSSLNPIHAAMAPNAAGGLNNAKRKGAIFPSSPLSDVIQEFYSSLNDKDSKRLQKFIAPDCVMEDTAYYKPLDAKVLPALFFPPSEFNNLCVLKNQAIRSRSLMLEIHLHAVYPCLLEKIDGGHGRERQVCH